MRSLKLSLLLSIELLKDTAKSSWSLFVNCSCTLNFDFLSSSSCARSLSSNDDALTTFVDYSFFDGAFFPEGSCKLLTKLLENGSLFYDIYAGGLGLCLSDFS